jgi:hypothetical protein
LGLLIDRRSRHMEGLADELEHIWRNLGSEH